MGMSPEAKLVYGYQLGGREDGWAVAEAGEYGEWLPAWAPSEDDDLVTEAERVLLAAAGFTETDYKVPGYFERKRSAADQLGVTFEMNGSCDFSGWILATHEISVEWSGVKEIDFAALEALRAEGDWDAKLTSAIQVLGVTPNQERPAWLLVSYYG